MQTKSETDLLDQLKTEDSSSFKLLYELSFPSVASYVRQNQGNNQDAEDVFQEAIIVLFQKVRNPEFVLSSSLKTYLYAISKNLWLKHIRDNKIKTVDNELVLSNKISDTIDIEPETTKEEKVENWLLKITRNCQNILKALFFYEVPMEQLMVKMGWKNKHTSNNLKYKCIQQIKTIKEKDL